MLATETWKPIPGFPSYFASDRGKIGSTKRVTSSDSHIRMLKYHFTETNIRQYKLRVDGRYVTISGQRLVALTYHENPDQYRFTRRIDTDSLSDAPDNVEWCRCNWN